MEGRDSDTGKKGKQASGFHRVQQSRPFDFVSSTTDINTSVPWEGVLDRHQVEFFTMIETAHLLLAVSHKLHIICDLFYP